MVTELERLRVGVADRYRVERELGRGGMAAVYLAEDLKHHRQVAIKVLKPEVAAALGPDRFLREIEIAARLTHPHILPLYDSGEADGLLYYVMPFVEGESLRDRLARQKQLSLHETIEIARAVADALSYAHSLGIVHRDIKPENILFEAGHAVVTDFGIARAITEAGGEHLTQTGIAVGTPAYMSPEQSAGAREVDARSDIYALGCVLYELLAGEPPFTGPSAQAVLARHSLDPVPRLRTVRETVPKGLEAVVLRALAKVPADRFATAREFAEAVEQSARVAEVTGPLSFVRRRRAIPLAVAAAVVVVALGGWWALTRPWGQSARIESLAVLPLTNLMGDSEHEYFVDGMHEALITELSRISALKVISRTSTMRYRDTEKPLPQVARELKVDGLIEGSVLREGDRVRITVQLIHGPSDRHVWAQSFDQELRGVLALQSEVARAVADEIKLRLTRQEEALLAAARRIHPEAYDAYLRARYELSKTPASEALQNSLQYFRQAIDMDPTYAPAYVGLADAYNRLAISGHRPPSEVYPMATAALVTALELDETLADAHTLLGVVKLRFDWEWHDAERHLKRALQLDPNSSRAHLGYGVYLLTMGRLEEYLAQNAKHRELDPLSPFANRNLGWALTYNRRHDQALVQFHKTLELDPGSALTYVSLGENYAAQNRYGEALAACDEALRLGPEDPQALSGCGRVHALSGRHRDAVRTFDKIVTLSEQRYVDPYDVAKLAAAIHTDRRERNRIFDWLERAYEERSANLCFVNVEPAFDNVRSDPRFQDLVRRMNFPG